MAGVLKVDSINADSNLALKIANTAVAFIDATGLRPVAGNLNLDATATSKLYLPSANTVAIQTAGVTAVTVDSSQNTTLAGTLTTTGITNSGVATGARFNPTGSSVTGTGMYLPAANSLGLSTNGTNAVYIDSSQKVGIGTSSPNANLQVSGGIQVTGTPTIGSTGVGVEIGYGLVNASEGAIQAYNRSGSAWINMAYSALAHKFLANNSEAMRIDSSGSSWFRTTGSIDTWVATTGTYAKIGDPTYPIGTTAPGLNMILNRNTSTGQILEFKYNGTAVGTVSVTGSATAYNTSSDYRLKENIAPIIGALTKVAQLKPVTYKWKVDGSDGEGFIAHELAEVFPQAVDGTKDAVDENGKPIHQGIDTSFLVATLTAAIQELKQINDTQAETITALTARIVALETI
jgi:hypothetical protein